MAYAIKLSEAQKKARRKENKRLQAKYDVVHKQLMDYILSGESHSTLIGMTISMDHSDEGISEVEAYVEYIVNQLRQAEEHALRKDNVN